MGSEGGPSISWIFSATKIDKKGALHRKEKIHAKKSEPGLLSIVEK